MELGFTFFEAFLRFGCPIPFSDGVLDEAKSIFENILPVTNPPVKSNNKTKFGDVSDGLSNTVMITEVLQGTSNDLRGFSWWIGVRVALPPIGLS